MPRADDWYEEPSHLDHSITVIEGGDDPRWYDTGILDEWGDPVYGRVYRQPAGFIHHPDGDDE